MAYRIAGVDVHKKMLAVVVADVEGESEYPVQVLISKYCQISLTGSDYAHIADLNAAEKGATGAVD